jgi:predicted neutral ceramidase superfamily lipid hydrolase
MCYCYHLFVFVNYCQLLIYGYFFHQNLDMEDTLLCVTNYCIVIIITIVLLSSNRPSDLLRSIVISLEVCLLTFFLWGRSKAFVLVVWNVPFDLSAGVNFFCIVGILLWVLL